LSRLIQEDGSAIKLLEEDDEVKRTVEEQKPSIKELEEKIKREIEEIHGHDAPSVIASERYAVADRIASEVTTHLVPKITLKVRFERATTHSVFGYIFMAAVMLTIFYTIFVFGNYVSGLPWYGGWIHPAVIKISCRGLPNRLDPYYWLEFTLSGATLPRLGKNEIQIDVTRRNPIVIEDLVLHDAEIILRYKEPPQPTGLVI